MKAERKAARAAGWVKCPSCHGRGEWRQWGAFAQTVGCEDCGGLGYVEPLPKLTAAMIEAAIRRARE